MEKIFIGVPWPYTNGDRHLGHAVGMLVPSDITARYHRLKGNDVLMVSGSDMHGTPTTIRAEKEGVKPEVISQKYHKRHMESFSKLGITYDLYTSTATENHEKVVHDIFLTLRKRGFLVEKKTKQWFCEKCKRFLPDRYVEGTCPHCGFSNARGDQCDECGRILDALELKDPKCKTCGSTPVVKETKHQFIKLSKFEKQLKAWLEKKEHWRPFVKNFTLNLVKEGLPDRPVTRDLTFGVSVPFKGYEKKTVYVWVEAIIGYLSAAIEYSKIQGKPGLWESYWKDPKCKHYYFMGKDNITFHALLWPAILLGYDKSLNLPYNIVATHFLGLEGRQFSVSRGHVVLLREVLKSYDPDAVRYALTVIAPERKDTDFSWKQFYEVVNNELIATYGNFVNRVLTFVNKYFDGEIGSVYKVEIDDEVEEAVAKAFKVVGKKIEGCWFADALREVMKLAQFGNKYIDSEEPWETVKAKKEKCANTMYNGLYILNNLRVLTRPFIPFSAERLGKQLGYLTGVVPKKGKDQWQPGDWDQKQRIDRDTKPLFKLLDPKGVKKELKKLSS